MNKTGEKQKRIDALGYAYGEQPKQPVEHCNLCGAETFVQIGHRDRYGYSAPSFACARCGLVFISPRMTAEAYAAFYASMYRPLVSAFHGREINAKSIQQEQGEYALDRADFAAGYLEGRANSTLLDIGGSTGVVAAHFAERFGYAGVVLDPSAEELQEAAARGLETIQGLFEEVDFSGRAFDLVLLCQTVDHLLDIDLTLKKIRECLAPDGLFFVDIVDFRAGYLRNWSVAGTIKVDHPYYLTQETMEAFLTRNGFDVLHKGYAADGLHISYLCTAGEEQPEYLPAAETVVTLLREVRTVQNAPQGAML